MPNAAGATLFEHAEASLTETAASMCRRQLAQCGPVVRPMTEPKHYHEISAIEPATSLHCGQLQFTYACSSPTGMSTPADAEDIAAADADM